MDARLYTPPPVSTSFDLFIDGLIKTNDPIVLLAKGRSTLALIDSYEHPDPIKGPQSGPKTLKEVCCRYNLNSVAELRTLVIISTIQRLQLLSYLDNLDTFALIKFSDLVCQFISDYTPLCSDITNAIKKRYEGSFNFEGINNLPDVRDLIAGKTNKILIERVFRGKMRGIDRDFAIEIRERIVDFVTACLTAMVVPQIFMDILNEIADEFSFNSIYEIEKKLEAAINQMFMERKVKVLQEG